jgi:hypothetical protein
MPLVRADTRAPHSTMTRSKFAPYGPGQLKALRTLRLKCDNETGRTEPFVWMKPNCARLSLDTRNARLAAMKLLRIREGECWQRPLSS